MLDAEIMALAKEHLSVARLLPLPEGFVDGHWDNYRQNVMRDLDGCRTCAETIQKYNGSPFNHRSNFDPGLIERKVKALQEELPEFDFIESGYEDHPDASESSTQDWHGRKISNILFWHLYPILACRKFLCQAPKRILEIGGGSGDQARLWKLMIPEIQWVDIDLPESLFVAEVFLRRNFPNAMFTYITEERQLFDGPEPYTMADFVFCPVQLAKTAKVAHYDIAINQGSMQEMPPATIDYWLRFLELADVDSFYSLNYHVTPLDRTENWELVRKVEDPLVITMDSGVNLEQAWRIKRGLIVS